MPSDRQRASVLLPPLRLRTWWTGHSTLSGMRATLQYQGSAHFRANALRQKTDEMIKRAYSIFVILAAVAFLGTAVVAIRSFWIRDAYYVDIGPVTHIIYVMPGNLRICPNSQHYPPSPTLQFRHRSVAQGNSFRWGRLLRVSWVYSDYSSELHVPIVYLLAIFAIAPIHWICRRKRQVNPRFAFPVVTRDPREKAE